MVSARHASNDPLPTPTAEELLNAVMEYGKAIGQTLFHKTPDEMYQAFLEQEKCCQQHLESLIQRIPGLKRGSA